MAYSDYGGFAFRHGVRVEERSDCVLSPGGIKSTPGAWPGWFIPEGRQGGSYHVLLGDGPIFVSLYKQTCVAVHRGFVEVDAREYAPAEALESYEVDGGRRYFIDDGNIRDGEPLRVNVDGCTIEFAFTYEDNYYVYAKLTQPDGTTWCGFSGYGVGAGL